MSNSSIESFLLPPITKYRLSEEIGSGAYGVVYKGLREDDGVNIALKRIFITDKDGNNNIPLSTHRELCALKKLNLYDNRNIVKLFDVVLNRIEGKMCMDLVFELGDYDLEKYLKKFNSCGDMQLSKIINLSKQLIDAINFMHSYCVIHRDLKPANILINKSGTDLKITDFGLARILGFDSSLTPVVVTLWYRSPEILLQRSYLTACDVWSAGCIIAEMVYGKPIFTGDNELSQIEKIVTRLGFEAIDNWPEDNGIDAPSLKKLIDKSRSLENILKRVDQQFLKLIKDLLRFDPDMRILSSEASSKLDKINQSYSRVKEIKKSVDNCISPSVSEYTRTDCSLKEWEIETQNEMIVNSVVRNVLDGDDDDLLIPGIIDNEPINCYPHKEIEIEDDVEEEESSVGDNDDDDEDYKSSDGSNSCSETESCEETQIYQDGAFIPQKDEVGDSFSSYRSCQNNCSFSSQAPSSRTGADTTTDDEHTECSNNNNNNNKEIAGFSEFNEKFDDTVIRDDGLPDLVVPVLITSSEDENADETNEETCSAPEPSPIYVRTQSKPSNASPLPFSLSRQNSDRSYSTPFKEVNDCNRLIRTYSNQSKEQFGRKRNFSTDDSSDSENETGEPSPIPSVEIKPNLLRQKSLRRRVSMLGPHVSTDMKPRSTLSRSESVRIQTISEIEENRDISFGERSLSRVLDSIQKSEPQKRNSQLSDRPKILVRRSTIAKKQN